MDERSNHWSRRNDLQLQQAESQIYKRDARQMPEVREVDPRGQAKGPDGQAVRSRLIQVAEELKAEWRRAYLESLERSRWDGDQAV